MIDIKLNGTILTIIEKDKRSSISVYNSHGYKGEQWKYADETIAKIDIKNILEQLKELLK